MDDADVRSRQLRQLFYGERCHLVPAIDIRGLQPAVFVSGADVFERQPPSVGPVTGSLPLASTR